MLIVKWFAWACFGTAGLFCLWAAGINASGPLVFVLPLLVSGVLMLALDLALTRLTEIRDALLSVRGSLTPALDDTCPDSDSPNGTGPARSIADLEAAITQAKGRQERSSEPHF
ncbi:hypothetical protein [Rhodovulum adriaticum]|uniref:Uncharacterized protein n=1 Tax=Rhodovulum adriaticum TaxID=35804 RepID=A0A4R2NWT1_RHOAD|nr:hypothetical protein [Rhodovulum adriaticum]MBK1634336.1 hypothetical protein [Rhodovulum adriaticum]TCP26061.1 hypothetical protein EV656_10222 [Rhodovulum adriaticum]